MLNNKDKINDLKSLTKNENEFELTSFQQHQQQHQQDEVNFHSSSMNLVIDSKSVSSKMKTQKVICMSLLFIVNLLKYMDRFTIAGVLRETQAYFKINDKSSGLIQTVFICSYMLIAPLFGYLGDRYSRKVIIIIGVSFWSSVNFISSFVLPNVSH